MKKLQDMKRSHYLFFLILLMTTSLYSCQKDKIETPVPVEDLKAYAGKNRAKLEFAVPQNAGSGKVFYGNGNFVEFVVSDAGSIQSLVIEGLPEEEQILRVVTISGEGAVSDPRGVRVNVYGSNYQNGLKPRKYVDQTQTAANSIQVQFEGSATDETAVRIVYTNTAGAVDSLQIDSHTNTATINDIDTDKPYYYYSVFKPEAESIDLFYSSTVDLKLAIMLDFKKTEWTIAGFSSEKAGMEAASIIDNDVSSAWQSETGSQFPHWITVDMSGPKLIEGFYYVNYQGNGKSPKTIRFEVSNDNTDWTVVLETEVSDSYLRQQLPLAETVAARYVKVTVVAPWQDGVQQTQFAEIDAYNNQNTSGANGKDEYTSSTPVSLVNATSPFQGDGSNPFPALGDYRMQKLMGWTHSANAVVSYDNNGRSFSLFIAPVWGLAPVTNGKVHQSISLQPGHYRLKIHVGSADGPADIFGVVGTGGTLPDYTEVTTSPVTLKYSNLGINQNKTVEMIFAVTDPSSVDIGVVYNIRDQFAANSTPWSSFGIRGFELAKIE